MASRADENGRCYRQVAALKAKYPESRANWKQGTVTWTGRVQPSPLCDMYTVRISWDGHRRRPVVRILHPRLATPVGKSLPHVFPGVGLCLHFPGEWTPGMLIADSIIPWTSEWLYFYEFWFATGEWHGGGHDPRFKDTETEELVTGTSHQTSRVSSGG
jgi:hypothetical protein